MKRQNGKRIDRWQTGHFVGVDFATAIQGEMDRRAAEEEGGDVGLQQYMPGGWSQIVNQRY